MKPNCNKCKFYVFSTTLGSKDKSIWHCRFGFSPFSGLLHSFEPPVHYDCRKEGEYNLRFMKPVQLLFNFD